MIPWSKQKVICFDILVAALLLIAAPTRAEYVNDEENMELMVVELHVEQQLVFDLEAFLFDEEVFLPADQFFRHLNIRTNYRERIRELEVYFPDSDNPVVLEMQPWDELEEGEHFLVENNRVFLHERLIEKRLGFDIHFDFNSLVISVKSADVLPIIRAHDRRRGYAQFTSPEQHSLEPEKTLRPKRRILGDGVLDWSLQNTYTSNPYQLNYFDNHNLNYNFDLGTQFLGGNLHLRGSGSDSGGFDVNALRGKWTLPVYGTSALKKIEIGEFSHRDRLEFTETRLEGIKITNAPHQRPYYFDRLELNHFLDPGLDTELYLNRRLYQVRKANNSSDLSAPLRYGSNQVEIRQYSDFGLEQRRRYHIHVPPQLVPGGNLEYNISAGRYQQRDTHYAGRGSIRFGLTNNWTVGGGSVTEMMDDELRTTPYFQSWMRLGKRTVLQGRHVLGYQTAGSLQFNFPRSRRFRFAVQHYQSSERNRYNRYLQASTNITFPIFIGQHRISTYANSRYNQSQSGFHNLNINSGINTRFLWKTNLRIRNGMRYQGASRTNISPSELTSEVELSRGMLRRLYLMPSVIYDHHLQELSGIEARMRIRFGNSTYMNLQYRRDLSLDTNRFFVTMRIEFPFARFNSRVEKQGRQIWFNHHTMGSLRFNSVNNRLNADKNHHANRAMLSATPYLDINNNGEREKDERQLDPLGVNVYRAGRPYAVARNDIIADRLIPYYSYGVRLNKEYLPNPLWRTDEESYQVRVVPNSFNSVEVPVTPVGEVAGRVDIETDTEFTVEGLAIRIASADGDFRKTIETYRGGSFYFVGLMPGDYTATLSGDSLAKDSLQVDKESIAFTIDPDEQGDIVDGLSFKVTELAADKPPVSPSRTVKKRLTRELYVLQIGAFDKEYNAQAFAAISQIRLNRQVFLTFDERDQLYKVQTGYFESYDEAEKVKQALRSMSKAIYNDVFIVKLAVVEE